MMSAWLKLMTIGRMLTGLPKYMYGGRDKHEMGFSSNQQPHVFVSFQSHGTKIQKETKGRLTYFGSSHLIQKHPRTAQSYHVLVHVPLNEWKGWNSCVSKSLLHTRLTELSVLSTQFGQQIKWDKWIQSCWEVSATNTWNRLRHQREMTHV